MMNENEYIRAHYCDLPIKVIAANLGRSYTFVAGRLKKMGLQVPLCLKWKNKRQGLKKGHGWNKGLSAKKYLSEVQYNKIKATQFKKGHVPHNTKYDNAITIRSDGYAWVRLGLSHWDLLHRIVYQKHYNVQLTSKDNIIFIDGNRNNYDPKNLKCVSNAELMHMNTWHKYPAELKDAMRVLKKLNRLIN